MADTTTIHAIGRRKEAVCRVYLRPGSGKWDVNGRTLGDYFPRPTLVSAIQQPFTATDTLGRYDVKAKCEGGGQNGQAGALRLAVAGAGIVRLSDVIVGGPLRAGELTALLTDVHHVEPFPLAAIYPAGRQRLPRVKVFIDFLAERFHGRMAWTSDGETTPQAAE